MPCSLRILGPLACESVGIELGLSPSDDGAGDLPGMFLSLARALPHVRHLAVRATPEERSALAATPLWKAIDTRSVSPAFVRQDTLTDIVRLTRRRKADRLRFLRIGVDRDTVAAMGTRGRRGSTHRGG